MIAIIDYGVGNLFSLKSSFDAIGAETIVTRDEAQIKGAQQLVLPGVGAFRDAMEKLRLGGLDRLICSLAETGKPILGICLGMQLLFEESHEHGVYPGLGLLKGQVRPISESIPKGLKIPHMGWNALTLEQAAHPLFRYIREGDYVYFVHSYSAVGCGPDTIATADYGAPLTAAVAKDNLLGCQFHPEKSGAVGLELLRAFCEMGGKAS